MEKYIKYKNTEDIITSILVTFFIWTIIQSNFNFDAVQQAAIIFIDLTQVKEWFLNLGAKYNVNPWLFGSIYIGAIPFFTLSVTWLVKNYKKGKSIVLPVLSSGFFFISAYLYLIVAGKNVPWWVYGFVVVMIVYGSYTTIRKIKKQIKVNNEI